MAMAVHADGRHTHTLMCGHTYTMCGCALNLLLKSLRAISPRTVNGSDHGVSVLT